MSWPALQYGEVVHYPGDRRDCGVYVGGEVLWLGCNEPGAPEPYPDTMDPDGLVDNGERGCLAFVGRTGMVVPRWRAEMLHERCREALRRDAVEVEPCGEHKWWLGRRTEVE